MRNSRAQQFNVPIVLGKVVAVHVFMSDNSDISKISRFRRVDSHKIGLPKHHRDTSYKAAPEAMDRNASRLDDVLKSSDVLGMQL